MSITNKLTYLEQTKEGIKQAIINKGVSVSDSDTFRSYIDKIDSITTGGGSGSDCNVSTCWDSLGYTTDDISGLDVHIAKAQDIKDTWDSSKTSYYYADNIMFFPNVDVSNLTLLHPNSPNSTNLLSVFPSVRFTNKLTTMQRMFNQCKYLTLLDVSGWDTSNVTDMSYAFYYCSSLTEIEGIEDVDTSNVTDIKYIFNSCNSLTSLDLSGWDTSGLENTDDYQKNYQIFYNCSSLTSLNVTGWDTSGLQYLRDLFYGCSKLPEIIGINTWDTSNAKLMYGLFYGCSNLTSLDLSNWRTANVTSMFNLFRGTTKLEYLNLTGWDTSSVTTMDYLLEDSGVKKIDGVLDLGVCDYNSNYFLYQYGYLPNLHKITFKNIGNRNAKTSLTKTSGIGQWGVNTDEIPDAKQSLIDSLITYSFDRASAGYSTHTITLGTQTKAVLTEEEIAQITAKGYTIA